MQVSRGGYYLWLHRPQSLRAAANDELPRQIKGIYEQSDQTYGSPRVHEELKEAGILWSQKRVAPDEASASASRASQALCGDHRE
jgi:hypothetical protein